MFPKVYKYFPSNIFPARAGCNQHSKRPSLPRTLIEIISWQRPNTLGDPNRPHHAFFCSSPACGQRIQGEFFSQGSWRIDNYSGGLRFPLFSTPFLILFKFSFIFVPPHSVLDMFSCAFLVVPITPEYFAQPPLAFSRFFYLDAPGILSLLLKRDASRKEEDLFFSGLKRSRGGFYNNMYSFSSFRAFALRERISPNFSWFHIESPTPTIFSHWVSENISLVLPHPALIMRIHHSEFEAIYAWSKLFLQPHLLYTPIIDKYTEMLVFYSTFFESWMISVVLLGFFCLCVVAGVLRHLLDSSSPASSSAAMVQVLQPPVSLVRAPCSAGYY